MRTHPDYDSLPEALEDLKKRGYTEDFNLKPHCLACARLQLELRPEQFSIDETYRFEGQSNPDDNAVIFAVSASPELRGTLVDAYGVYAEALTPEMAQKLRISNKTSNS
jgi:hypothetical protein